MGFVQVERGLKLSGLRNRLGMHSCFSPALPNDLFLGLTEITHSVEEESRVFFSYLKKKKKPLMLLPGYKSKVECAFSEHIVSSFHMLQKWY